MDGDISKCPVAHLLQPTTPSRCPFGRLFGWFRDRIAHITKVIPFRVQNPERDELVRVSSIYASLLIKHKADVIADVRKRLKRQGQGFIEICKPGSVRDDILGDIFFDPSILNPTLGLSLVEVDMNHEQDFEVIMKSEEAFYRAKALYQTGITNIGQVWTMLLQKYKAVYGRFPSPEELKSFRSFTAYYATKLGESPSFLANAITSGMKESGAKQALKIDDSGEVHIGGKALAVAQRKATITFRTTTNIQVSVINGYCPAVSMIPKIADMCCEAFEAGYADVYNLKYK